MKAIRIALFALAVLSFSPGALVDAKSGSSAAKMSNPACGVGTNLRYIQRSDTTASVLSKARSAARCGDFRLIAFVDDRMPRLDDGSLPPFKAVGLICEHLPAEMIGQKVIITDQISDLAAPPPDVATLLRMKEYNTVMIRLPGFPASGRCTTVDDPVARQM